MDPNDINLRKCASKPLNLNIRFHRKFTNHTSHSAWYAVDKLGYDVELDCTMIQADTSVNNGAKQERNTRHQCDIDFMLHSYWLVSKWFFILFMSKERINPGYKLLVYEYLLWWTGFVLFHRHSTMLHISMNGWVWRVLFCVNKYTTINTDIQLSSIISEINIAWKLEVTTM